MRVIHKGEIVFLRPQNYSETIGDIHLSAKAYNLDTGTVHENPNGAVVMFYRSRTRTHIDKNTKMKMVD